MPMPRALQRLASTTLLLLVAMCLLVDIQQLRARAQTTAQPSPTPVAPTEAPQQQPSVIRIEPVGPLHLAGEKASAWTYMIPTVGPLISGLLAFFGVWLGL